MLFNSFEFLIFFALFAAGWPIARKYDLVRWTYVIAFSLFFYGWWDWKYVPLMLFSVLVDYTAGIFMHRIPKYAKLIVTAALSTNLLVLGYFKYSYFVAVNSVPILALLGFDVTIEPNQVILPLGISFYTFQSMSYSIDIYRKQITPTYNFMHFLSAVTFFPQLVAGPIMRARDIVPQLATYHVPEWWTRWTALRLIVDGFFRKVVIADNLAGTVNDAFAGRSGTLSMLDWWLVIIMFAFQIYFDFSGYSNIARGTARILGYELIVNFNIPYKSTSLREFWTRWHISLSTWFRDYVYIPLGGSHGGLLKTIRNVVITFSLSGLWHGAGWPFIIWGFLHGSFIAVERLTSWPERLAALPGGRFAAWLIVMLFVLISWVFFRSADLGQALYVIGQMFTFGALTVSVSMTACIFLSLGMAHEFLAWVGYEKTDTVKLVTVREVALCVFMIAACIYLRGPGQTFVYFQF
jgi:alginate O-acetyltransferase complex protein AlgI